MGSTKKMLLQMREDEIANLYPSDFKKKEALSGATQFVANLIKSGNVSVELVMTNIIKLKTVVDTIESQLRNHIPHEKLELNGVEFTPVDGGFTLDYEDDEIYRILKKDLENRVELLKLAQHQEIIDGYGNAVPKVGKTPRKSSIQIRFK
jgi:hypothetical protein